MDTADRPHRSNNNSGSGSSSSELFICFTSRLSSSSSMKISSKSILSPGRAREPSQISLSASLSRRLRNSGSMRGGQASPMFPTNTGKKRGCGFENPEPSSPKVTCIGQVRVKTKKQGRKMRARSKRRGGEVSFRRAEDSNTTNVNHQLLNQPPPPQQPQPAECLPHRNQRWVHLPMTICEALRALGGDLNCFLPCRSSCTAGEKEKEDRVGHGSGNGSACGFFARWLVAVQDGEGKGREIELVVGGEEEEEEEEKRRSYRRHVFEEIEFKEEMEEEEARVSICIPPKNALLLMRCRSDPVRMAALSNKFWEPTVPDEPEGAEEEEEEKTHEVNAEQVNNCSLQEVGSARLEEKSDIEHIEEVISGRIEVRQAQDTDTGLVNLEDRDGEDMQEQSRDSDGEEEENSLKQEMECMNRESGDDHENEFEMHQENENGQEDKPKPEAEQEIGEGFSDESSVFVGEQEHEQESEFVGAGQDLEDEEEEGETKGETETTEMKREEEEATTSRERSESEDHRRGENGQTGSTLREGTERQQALLPDCLLLMMCEPKLSMEVSKETWVCSTDFMRSLPQHPKAVVSRAHALAEEPKKRTRGASDHTAQQQQQQPPRSSCSYPAKPPARAAGTESMSNVIEKKMVGGKGYEALVLKRCKSEPMRTAAKLAAEPCFWKNRKLEGHRPAAVGVGAAGVGF